jgi:glycosyltransferase involved in cell wall biosynthesis
MPRTARRRLTVVMTHPVQYLAPLYALLHQAHSDLDLTVVYAVLPTGNQQGVGYDQSFAWDVPLLEGYCSRVVRPGRAGDDIHSSAFAGLDVPEIVSAVRDTRPDVVLLPGWHSSTLVRALVACRAARVPVVYRGDTNLQQGPRGVRRPLWEWRSRAVLSLFSGFLSVGTLARHYLEELAPEGAPIVDSPHCVDNALFAEGARLRQIPEDRLRLRQRLGASPEHRIALFVGQLESRKAVDELVRASALLGGRWHVWIAGGGVEELSLRALARHSGASVEFRGFVHQRGLGQLYAAADALVLPSRSETWGMVVNEALASGLPCVVSDRVGCAPDLVDDTTGATFPSGDTAALSRALQRVDQRLEDGWRPAEACEARARRFSLSAAAAGIAELTARLVRRPRVVVCAGGMVAHTGLERMTFEVLRVLREESGAVHLVANNWSNQLVADFASEIGATWSEGRYWEKLDRHTRDPRHLARIAYDIAYDSTVLMRAAQKLGATHVLVPEFLSAIRNAPALALLKRRGVRVIMRVGNAPADQAVHRWFWRRVIAPCTDLFVANSEFLREEVRRAVGPSSMVIVVPNTPSSRVGQLAGPLRRHADRVIFVGQIIPEKGVDLLLDAIGILVRKGVDVRLDVVGSIEGWVSPTYAGYREHLFARAAQSDLAGRVEFLGWREDVPELLARATVHCAPSRPEQKEGMAGVVLEAKRAGTPSVVAPSGALPEMVRHGQDGLVVREASPEALADGLEYFLRDSTRAQLAGAAAAQSIEAFGRSRFKAAWLEVFAC